MNEAQQPDYPYEEQDWPTPEPPRCRVGSQSEHPCPHPAAGADPVGGMPLCEHHLRVSELNRDVAYWALVEEVVRGWADIAEFWDEGQGRSELTGLTKELKARVDNELALAELKLEQTKP